MRKELALIGCGNMGTAIIRGILGAGLVPAAGIAVTSHSPVSAARLADELGVTAITDNAEAARDARIVFIAVKPALVPAVAKEIAPALDADAIVVSIAAGLTLARLEELLGGGRKIVRVMPNLPAMVGAGMSALTPNERVGAEETAEVKQLLEGFGKAEVVPEGQMDAVVAVSGSGPAYVCLFIEALADAGVAEGMPRATAYAFAEQTVLGTVAYLQETGTHPGVLKDRVSSPAGTTIEAVAALEERGLRSAVIEAARICAQRNRELG